ncbi:hypothetical protein C8R44DRAFT_884975 [Mycena epipterygia]|nr:hypothetical protein C8R44DRAFT_884975 [Mycena epipterygia]
MQPRISAPPGVRGYSTRQYGMLRHPESIYGNSNSIPNSAPPPSRLCVGELGWKMGHNGSWMPNSRFPFFSPPIHPLSFHPMLLLPFSPLLPSSACPSYIFFISPSALPSRHSSRPPFHPSLHVVIRLSSPHILLTRIAFFFHPHIILASTLFDAIYVPPNLKSLRTRPSTPSNPPYRPPNLHNLSIENS